MDEKPVFESPFKRQYNVVNVVAIVLALGIYGAFCGFSLPYLLLAVFIVALLADMFAVRRIARVLVWLLFAVASTLITHAIAGG